MHRQGPPGSYGDAWGHDGRPARQWRRQYEAQISAPGAGLGHIVPHDLRRSAAGIVHRARTADGRHLCDLLDIQRVLDRADRATRQRNHIDPLTSHDVKDRASVTRA
jgi:hypothetical protein